MVDSFEETNWDKATVTCLDVKNSEKPENNAKKQRAMGLGLRRIFSPMFKIQVLDSYRQDLDCRGNQRATARKYNIHRRQIQKWLQCEQQLREAIVHGKISPPKQNNILNKKDGGNNAKSPHQTRLCDSVQHPRTKVIQQTSSSNHSVHNLKLVAQKLYPSSYNMSRENNLSPVNFSHVFNRNNNFETSDKNFNQINSQENFLRVPKDVTTKLSTNDINFKNSSTFSDCNVENISSLNGNDAVLDINKQNNQFISRIISTNEKMECNNNCIQSASDEVLSGQQAQAPETNTSSNHHLQTGTGLDVSEPSPSAKPPLISPKRKWIQESMSENRGKEESKRAKTENVTSPVLPIKQRVKMLRTQTQKSVPTNFSIESLCAKDEKCSTSGDKPLIEAYNPQPPYLNCHFTRPLVFQHRAIPDLRSLHFKPEIHPINTSQTAANTFEHQSNYDEQVHQGFVLKEERISESEDNEDDVDVTSTTPIEDKTFDFTNNTTKRRSFSVQFKLDVLDAFYVSCHRNQRATARKYNVNRRQIQKWLSQEADLRKKGSHTSGTNVRHNPAHLREGDNSCKQCPQHCKPDLIHKDDQLCIKKEFGMDDNSVNKNFNYLSHDELTVDKFNSYENCNSQIVSYNYCPGYSHNLSVHLYPYHVVCDWPQRFDVMSSSNCPSYPCSYPPHPCQSNLGVV